jgi:hypothetical protein
MSTFNFSPSSSAKGSPSNACPRRWSSLASRALGAVFAMGVLTAGQAQAVVVNVPGYGTWDVTTFTGSYNDYSAKFNFMELGGVMPWWVEEPAARAFDAAVGASLGDFDLNGGSRPIFGYTYFGGVVGIVTTGPQVVLLERCESWVYQGGLATCGSVVVEPILVPEQTFRVTAPVNDTLVWAQATPVSSPTPAPGPLPALGVAAAFGYSRKLRNRIKRSGNSASTTFTL